MTKKEPDPMDSGQAKAKGRCDGQRLFVFIY